MFRNHRMKTQTQENSSVHNVTKLTKLMAA